MFIAVIRVWEQLILNIKYSPYLFFAIVFEQKMEKERLVKSTVILVSTTYPEFPSMVFTWLLQENDKDENGITKCT